MMWQTLIFHPTPVDETILVSFSEPGPASEFFLVGVCHGALYFDGGE
jgi:hypothetical protein